MNRNRLLVLFVMLSVSGAAVHAAPQVNSLAPEQAQRIETAIAQQMDRMKIPGMTVAISMDGQVVYSKAFGKADLEHNVPATTSTLFRTASIAKTFTATAVMQLVEAGKIDLDAPVQKYCPAFPEKQWTVTTRQILSHQAGIRHYNKPGESAGTEHFFTLTDSLRLFKDDPLLHEPGTK